MANNKAAKARDGVLAAERIRQNGLDQEASALNATSQQRYDNFQGQQDTTSSALGDYFAAPMTAAGDPSVEAPSALPSSSSDVVNTEIANKKAEAQAYVGQQGEALGDLRSFGDLLGGLSLKQARDANLVGQIGGFKNGSSNVVPLELDSASHAGDGMKLFGDILGGAGSIGVSAGLQGNNVLTNMFGKAPTVVKSVAPMARPAWYGGATNMLGG